MGVNLSLVVLCGLLGRQSNLERMQAVLFVEVDQQRGLGELWRGEATVAALRGLLIRFLGQERADTVFAMDLRRRGRVLAPDAAADATLVQLAERQLARAIGSASARVMVGSVVRGEVIGPDDLMQILDETSQAIEYSQRLEQKSAALEQATAELREANERLRQLDQLKDDFLATVSHELRTPLTSIRSFSEILLDTPDLEPEERAQFLQIIVRESERLTRLINDFLDLSKIESGKMEWQVAECELHGHRGGGDRRPRTGCSPSGASQLIQDLGPASAAVQLRQGPHGPGDDQPALQRLQVRAGRAGPGADRAARAGRRLPGAGRGQRPGRAAALPRGDLREVPPGQRQRLLKDKPKGTGLGLAICRQIVEHFGGRIWAEDAALGGAAICFTLPVALRETKAAA